MDNYPITMLVGKGGSLQGGQEKGETINPVNHGPASTTRENLNQIRGTQHIQLDMGHE